MSAPHPSQQAFEAAKNAFKQSLKDENLFGKLLATTSVEQVYEAVQDIQASAHVERRLRHLGKIRTFIEKLTEYVSVVDTFVQVKPDILALIWGPIRLLVVWTSSITKFADAVTDAMEKIGDALPHALRSANIFDDNDKLKALLELFYKDILDFYIIALKFFSLSRSDLVFEAVWPKQRNKIDVVVSNINRHTTLMRSEVTMQHISAEHEFRDKCLAHFDHETDFQELQRFQTLKIRVSPRIYDDRLDWLLNRSSKNSAEWLVADNIFRGWLDISNSAVRLLWLHGIPGAGKTFLSAAAIDEAKTRHRTLFVFVSHIYQNSTTARSILQSLLFQLAFDVKDAQSLLVESNERELLGSTRHVLGLLRTLLGTPTAGPTYIILDGLDEMEVVERGILLQQLTDLESCPELKILISSRREDDIASILGAKATEIRVDKRNSDSIQSYINQRTQDWIRTANFEQEIRNRVERLLAPVAKKANGMFLYARIILDNAETCNGLEEIERELRVLPVDLHDAYHRILARIGQSSSTLRHKAMLILGWIGSSPIPMTRHEMEQALLVDSSSNAAPAVIAEVNFVHICGPVIEVVDDSLQFVHFTVKEYIFSREVSGFIDHAEANHSLTKTLLSYLCSGAFDAALPDEKLQENILAGIYRLHWYATSQWVVLVRRCVEKSKDLSAYPDLLELLTHLVLELRSHSFNGQVDFNDRVIRAMVPDRPEISQFVCGILQFRQDDRQADWNYTNSCTWVGLDPSVMSFTSTRIYERLEELLCQERKHRNPPNCFCATLHRHYGTKIFKCSYPSCSLNRSGFLTREGCKTHIGTHSRPWKCRDARCLYATIGFSSKRDLHNHWQKLHESPQPAGLVNLTEHCFSRDELKVLVFELTKAGDVDGLRNITPHLERQREVVWPALLLAAKMGSLPIMEILSQFFQIQNNSDFFAALVKSENPTLFRLSLDKLCEQYPSNGKYRVRNYGSLAAEAFSTSSPELYAEWEDFLLDPARQLNSTRAPAGVMSETLDWDPLSFDEVQALIPHFRKLSVVFSKGVFSAVKKDALFETRLIQTWHRLIEVVGPLDPRFLGWSLNMLARSSSHSITMAAELLRLGALINFPRGWEGVIEEVQVSSEESKCRQRYDGKGKGVPRRLVKRYKGMTALHYASRATSEQAAQFARFLLEQGADPKYGWADVTPAEEKGAILMQKWLGESWDEVLARTKEARQERKREQGGESGNGLDEDEDEESSKPKRHRNGRKRQKCESDREEDEDEQLFPPS
ncbi:hypothetical protein B0T21DRAFT_375908 [Apiosordaria backusii]|uniref:NACHT domain-containing protein n=1 Tax=Apiosordaria backusii TaxID=314023 RepID=A0AA40AEM4_9PEZI|nr:hypothetical protein B0T21DRAFT_375908 [Apiosordaria backusii]